MGDSLRRRAEARLESTDQRQRQDDRQTDKLLFELEVHREELKIQNEELHRSRNETAELLRQYTDLYEFAPVGYFTIDADKTILQANLRAAEMLGCTRNRLRNRHFSTFVNPPDLPIFHELVRRVLESGAKQDCELRLVSAQETFDAQLHARHVDQSHPPLLQVAVFDITSRKEAQRALQDANVQLEKRVRERTAELQKSRRELQYIAENTIHLLERERRKISLDLHDTIAQGLATIKLLLENKLAMMRKEAPASPFSIERILEITARSLNETRRIMYYLRPKMLDEIGFLATLRWHWQEFERLHPDMVVQKDIRVSESELPEELTLVVYRIVQQATHNIDRHSRADRVEFQLQQQNRRLRLRIADNGGGFDAEQPLADPDKGMGMTCMKERAELSGGVFSLHSADGKGTVIEVDWNLDLWQR
jgi:PAS domain S-box-containing protein